MATDRNAAPVPVPAASSGSEAYTSNASTRAAVGASVFPPPQPHPPTPWRWRHDGMLFCPSHTRRLPLRFKLLFSAYVAIFVPVYLYGYGPDNFLYFCDLALLLSFAGVWLENSLLISMCAVGVLIPQLVWLADFIFELAFHQRGGWTDYMFDDGRPLVLRMLSLFHGWLPFVLLYLLARLGYDRRALPLWTIFTALLILVSLYVTPPPSPAAAHIDTPANINFVYGLSTEHPQPWVPQALYPALEVAIMVAIIFIPTHLGLRHCFRAPGEAARHYWRGPLHLWRWRRR